MSDLPGQESSFVRVGSNMNSGVRSFFTGHSTKLLLALLLVAIAVIIVLSVNTSKNSFDPRYLYQPGFNDEGISNLPEDIPWDAAIQNLGLDGDVITSHQKFVTARDGAADPTKVIKRAVLVVKDGKSVWSVDPADLSSAKPEDIKCMYFTRDQVPAGQFTNDKDCPGYQALYGDKSSFRFNTTASRNSVRDYDVDTVPWVGLRRPDYRVSVGSDARQVPSMDHDQLPTYRRRLI